MHLPTPDHISALPIDDSKLSFSTKAALAASAVALVATAALHRLYLLYKARRASRRARVSCRYTPNEQTDSLPDTDDVESSYHSYNNNIPVFIGIMNAGIPPFGWQAGAGLLPNPESQTLPAYHPIGDGSGGFIPVGGAGGLAGYMPFNMGGAMGGFSGMNANRMGQPKPQYVPPGPMPTGMYGGPGMGMPPYDGYGPMAGGMGMMMGPGMGGGLAPLHVPGPPGMTQTFPKGYATFHLIRASGSARRQHKLLMDLLNQQGMSFEFEVWSVPCTDHVGEFLKHIRGDKERYRLTEIREAGDGTWERAQHVKWIDEPGRFRRLESVGWGSKAGTGNGRPIWCVLWKKPERN